MKSLSVLRFSPDIWTLETMRLDQCLDSLKTSGLQYLLVQEDSFSTGKPLPHELLQHFRIPQYLLSDVYRRSNGFFAFEQSLNQDGSLRAYCTWFRFLVKTVLPDITGYTWREMTFFSRWDSQSCHVLCIGVDRHFQYVLQNILTHTWSGLPPSEQYSMHVPLIEAVVTLHDASVWSIRDSVRTVEKARGDQDFVQLDESARHAIHVHETISVSVETLEAIQRQASTLSRINKQRYGGSAEDFFQILAIDKQRYGGFADDFSQILACVDSQTRILRSLLSRSQSNKERLQNEIAFAYNIITQRDSQVMKTLGQATRADSKAMRMIAVVTMAFLPPTFLSAVFSMSFFNFTPGSFEESARWSVSDKFWIYWVLAVPLTALTLATWFWQQKLQDRPIVGVQSRDLVQHKSMSSHFIESGLA